MNGTPRPHLLNLEAAAESLRCGGVIAYPTETVFGLGCRWDDAGAVRRLVELKRREAGKGLILLGANRTQLEPLVAPLTEQDWETLLAPAPRPTTWVVPAACNIDAVLTGGRPTVAVRLTTDRVARALCLAVGCAIVSTSANLSGEPPARRPDELAPALLAGLDGVLNGACAPDATPSRIVDLRSGAILRP